MAKGKSAILSVRIVSDVENAIKGMERVGNKAGLMDKAMAAGAAALAAGGVAAAAYGASAVQAAGDLEQSQGAVQTIFKDSAAQMLAFSDNAATAVGLTKNEYNEMANLIGAQLKNTGTSMEELGPKTDGLISLGADLASMFGGTTAEAVGALSSALKGEMDPIERYGISLSDATLTAKGLEMGIEKVGGAFTAEQKAAITMAAIMDQSADAQGNFARETDTLAHKQQVFAAQLGNVKSTIGEHLLPIASQFFGFLSETAGPALQAFADNIPAMVTQAREQLTALGNWFTENQGTIVAVASVITAILAPALLRLAATTLYAKGVQVAAWAIVQAKAVWAAGTYVAQSAIMVAKWVWMGAVSMANAVRMAAAWFIALGPIGWAIAAIIAVVAVVVANWDTIKNWTINTWNTVSEWTANTWNAVTSWIGEKVEAAKAWVSGAWQAISDWTRGAWDGVISWTQGAWQAVLDWIGQKVDAVVNWVSGAWQAVVDWTSQAFENAKQAVFIAMVKLALVVIEKGHEVMQWFKDLPGNIMGAIGALKDKMLAFGGDLIGGLIRGIQDKAGQVAEAAKNAVSGAVDKVKNFLGIKSPSRLMRDEVGSMMGEGMAVGLKARARAVSSAAAGMAKTAFSAVKTAASKPVDIPAKVQLSAGPAAREVRYQAPQQQAQVINIPITVQGYIGNELELANRIEQALRFKKDLIAYG